MKTIDISENKGNFEIKAHILILGDDLLVVVSGGREHVGAVGIAQPRPSLNNSGITSATSSVYTFLGHKEDVIAKGLSEDLSKKLNMNVVVVAGIHWDNLKPPEIDAIMRLCSNLPQKIIDVVEGLK